MILADEWEEEYFDAVDRLLLNNAIFFLMYHITNMDNKDVSIILDSSYKKITVLKNDFQLKIERVEEELKSEKERKEEYYIIANSLLLCSDTMR